MGYNGKLELKQQAQQLRRQGFSYSEILKKISVSKDTLSRWCRDIPLSEKHVNRLSSLRKSGGLKGSVKGAQKQIEIRKNETLRQYAVGIREVGNLSKRDRFIAGICLYSGEGTKSDRVCEFTNADPELILFMTKWLKEFCNTKENKLRGALWLHDDLNVDQARQFWSELTGIPINQFYKTYIVKRKKKKQRKQLHPYGIFSIRYLDAAVSRRIIGWIAGLFGQTWYNNRIEKLHLTTTISPVAQSVEQDAVKWQP
jgi:transcriptional regulator with XRE-family HTH domain